MALAENKLFASKKQELENKKEMILKDDERSDKYKHEQVTAIERSLADLISNKGPLIAEMIEQEQKRLQENLANISDDIMWLFCDLRRFKLIKGKT